MKRMKTLALISALSLCAMAQSARNTAVDTYPQSDLASRTKALDAQGKPFASEDLKRYGNHYTMLAYRTETGSAEVHEHEADLFVIESGSGSLVEGGTVVDPSTTKPGEIRGKSIRGGKTLPIAPGTVVHIPAGVPHQMIITKGQPISYFVLKVTGQ